MALETETMNKLFLEMSQYVTAETAAERYYHDQLDKAIAILKALDDGEHCMTDHHGDCQEHYGSIEVAPDVWVCAVERARYLINDVEELEKP